jgi:subtilisin family serine protease
VVCSSGNDNKSDEQVPMYPAAYSEVISVTATTPEDKRKDISDKWNLSSAWAPNYGKKLHIGAPGICLPTTDFSGAAGYSTSNYITFSKTSSAAPVISGVVALLLSKNQALTSQEVKDKLAQQADKVGGYDYSYDALKPGHSKEMGFGRVNAFKAIEETPVGITEKTKTENSFTIAVENPVGSKLTINYDFSQLQQDVTLEIYDMEGKLHRKSLLYRHEEMVTIDVQDLSPGMYYSKLFNKEDELVQTVKFIKLW